MKKIISLFLAFNLLMAPAFAADQWDKTLPAGTTNISDIDTVVQTNNAALDRLVYNYRLGAAVTPSTSNQVIVLPGELSIPNSGGTVVKWRRNTSSVTLTWADIDTGAESSGAVTQYYVYALADADATTFTAKISLSASAPTGATYYRKIGYFTNDASNNIVSVGNIAGGDVRNLVSVQTTSEYSSSATSYTDVTGMVVYFVSSGRPVRAKFLASSYGLAVTLNGVIDIDGTDYGEIAVYGPPGNGADDVVEQVEISPDTVYTLAAGTHTIKVQAKGSSGTYIFCGSSSGGTCSSLQFEPLKLTVEEL